MRISPLPLLALATTVTLAVTLAACGSVGASSGTIGNDTRTFSEKGFDRVELAGPDNVSVTVGPAFAVTARGDQKVLDRLKLTVNDGELRVSRTPGVSTGRDRAEVSVTMPQIRGATLSGAGKLDIDRAEAPAFEGAISGAGGLRVGALKARTASFRMAGAGSLSVDGGETGTLDIDLSGAGSVNADRLAARDLRVSVSGVGSVKAQATGTAKGDVSGVGSVTVRGTDQCDIRKTGVGGVKCAR